MNRTNLTRSLLDPRALITSAALTSLLLAGSGCGSIGEGPQGPDSTEKDDNNAVGEGDDGGNNGGDNGGADNGGATGVVEPTPPGLPSEPCGEIALAAKEVLKTNCGSCHGAGGSGKGGFSNVLDAKALVTSGKIVAGKPDASPLYGRMSAGTMPPAAETVRPSAAGLASVKDWILCNAPDWDAPVAGAAAFLSVDARLRLMLDDLRDIPNPADRKRMRYIDLSNLSNAGFSAEQVTEYREGIALLLNSLSYGQTAIPNRAIDPDKLLYRIDLRDYGWDAANWDQIVEDYPYVVQYDQDSRLFPYDEVSAEQIRRETGTLAPYIQGDWLIAHGSQPPLYYDVLELSGKNLNQIAAEVGVNIQDNIDNAQVARSGFTISGVSEQNRMIERHEQPGSQGSFWLSYDFATNTGFENLQAHPLDFQEAGGEAIFHLPNGLLAYVIVDNQGNLLDKVPNFIATDPNSATREVLSGVSCMGCHAEGLIRKDDTIRDFVRTTAVNAAEREAVLELYVPVSEMQSLVDQDNDRYSRARTNANVVKFGALSMSRMVNTHERTLTLNQVAAVMGVTTAEFLEALDSTPQAFPAEIVTLRQTAGVITRETFEDVFEGILAGLGLGVSIDTPAFVN